MLKRKLYAFFLASFFSLCGCTAETPRAPGLLERLDGAWVYDGRATWQLRNPGRIFGGNSTVDDRDDFYGIRAVFDSQAGILDVSGAGRDALNRKYPYLIVAREEARVTLNLDGVNRIFALDPDGRLIACDADLNADVCVVLRRDD